MAVEATPSTYPGDPNCWKGYVSAAGSATEKARDAVASIPVANNRDVHVIP